MSINIYQCNDRLNYRTHYLSKTITQQAQHNSENNKNNISDVFWNLIYIENVTDNDS